MPKQKTIAKIVVWLAAEIILNFIGLDDLADYSEFIFEHNLLSQVTICKSEIACN